MKQPAVTNETLGWLPGDPWNIVGEAGSSREADPAMTDQRSIVDSLIERISRQEVAFEALEMRLNDLCNRLSPAGSGLRVPSADGSI